MIDAFPDYPANTLPPFAALGFTDVSDANDACPSFRRGHILVWANYPESHAHLRDWTEGLRFSVNYCDDDGCFELWAFDTDDWMVVEALLPIL